MRRAASILAAVTVAGVLLASPAHAATTANPPAEVAVVLSAHLPDAVMAPTTYVVQRGDTLTRIAARYCGNPAAYRSIGAASGIGNFDLIYPGQRLTLKCTGGVAPARKAPAVVHAQTASVAVSGSASRAVSFALAQVGKPYVFGALGPNAYDCSGLVVAAYRAAGISLPHFTGDLRRRGVSVSQNNLRPGDIVFLSSSHVGLFIGNNQVVVAPQTGERVKVQAIYHYTDGRRI